MASVTSLDKDLRKLRLDKYTPAAADEARAWVEDTLGQKLPPGDLLDGLHDGVALCKLANLVLEPPGVRFKQSTMPFVQMENISHFLAACRAPPLNLHQHDTFLTVDLYEQKDPAQVLQCLGAFSRAAHAASPDTFPTTIGPKTRAGISPQATGGSMPTGSRGRGVSCASNASSVLAAKPMLGHSTGDSASGRWSPTRSPTKSPATTTKSPAHTKSPSVSASPGNVTSWSRREQQGATSPAWNIAQYGYMGGASQGNLGISFGGRRQITNAAPRVPSLADKERLRREEQERLRQDTEEYEHEQERRRLQLEERDRLDEERRWEQETERLHQQERHRAEQEKLQWEQQERQWQLTEQQRRREEQQAQARLEQERRQLRSRGGNTPRLRGQLLSQYRAETGDDASDHATRIQHLERELELARQREAEYQREREQRVTKAATPKTASPKTSTPKTSTPKTSTPKTATPKTATPKTATPKTATPTTASTVTTRIVSNPSATPMARADSWASHDERDYREASLSRRHDSSSPPDARPLPNPPYASSAAATPPTPRPLPDPSSYSSPTSSSPPVASSPPSARRPALKSLLEREMELERQRQREWELAQQETARATPAPDASAMLGLAGRWDLGQWSGFTGGDGQNRGSHGIGAGRRQIVGPRPLPDTSQ